MSILQQLALLFVEPIDSNISLAPNRLAILANIPVEPLLTGVFLAQLSASVEFRSAPWFVFVLGVALQSLLVWQRAFALRATSEAEASEIQLTSLWIVFGLYSFVFSAFYFAIAPSRLPDYLRDLLLWLGLGLNVALFSILPPRQENRDQPQVGQSA